MFFFIICVLACIKIYVPVHAYVLVLQGILFIYMYIYIVSTGVGKVSQKKYGRFVKQNLNHHYKMDC